MTTTENIELTWDEMVETFRGNLLYDISRNYLSVERTIAEMREGANDLESIIIPNKNGIDNATYMITTGNAKNLIPLDLMRDLMKTKADLDLVGDNGKVITTVLNKNIK